MENKNDPTQQDSASASGPGGGKARRFWRVFWLAFLVLSLGYAWYSYYVPSNDVAWADDITTARHRAEESDKPMLLFFTAEWCVPCRIMKREIFADREAMTAINAKVVPVMLYEGEPDADPVFTQYKVRGTPVTIFTTSQGRVLDYAVGGIGKDRFMEMLQNLDTSEP
jgi:protein disulfide-isomerase